MLAISYIIILEILLLIIAIVFFLPLVIFIMRALGLGDRLPQARIHPETGKISQNVVDQIKLVYYTPAEEDDDNKDDAAQQQSQQDGEGAKSPGAEQDEQDRIMQSALAVPATPTEDAADKQLEAEPEEAELQARAPAATGGMIRLFFARRRTAARLLRAGTSGRPRPAVAQPGLGDGAAGEDKADEGDTSSSSSDEGGIRLRILRGASSSGGGKDSKKLKAEQEKEREKEKEKERERKRLQLKYPLHPIPAHRATCSICLCDFERPEEQIRERQRAREAEAEEARKARLDGDGKTDGDALNADDAPASGSSGAAPASSSLQDAAEVDEAQLPATRKEQRRGGGGGGAAFARLFGSRKRRGAEAEGAAEADGGGEGGAAGASDGTTEDFPEPLRLLACSHVFHVSAERRRVIAAIRPMRAFLLTLTLPPASLSRLLLGWTHVQRSCVDEWFTTVSGRCPICQVPIVKEEEEAAAEPQQGGQAAGEAVEAVGQRA